MIKNWIFLLTAIISEVIATSALKSSDGFSRLWPSVLVVLGYGIAFYCLALTLKVIPMGVAYGIWSGIGIVLITLVGWLLFDQKLDLPALLGIALIASGVIVMNVFSKTLGHCAAPFKSLSVNKRHRPGAESTPAVAGSILRGALAIMIFGHSGCDLPQYR